MSECALSVSGDTRGCDRFMAELGCMNGSDRRPSRGSLGFEVCLKTEGGILLDPTDIVFSGAVGVCVALGNMVKLGSNTPDEFKHET